MFELVQERGAVFAGGAFFGCGRFLRDHGGPYEAAYRFFGAVKGWKPDSVRVREQGAFAREIV